MYDTERLYKAGLLPARYYFQMNGKDAQENYILQKEDILKAQEQTEKEIEARAEEVIEKALQELFKHFPGTK